MCELPYWRYESPIKYQRQPNRWSCLPTAFAMCLGIDVENVITRIGHDGSEILRPHKPEPLTRRSFHPQELFKICYDENVAVTQFEVDPGLFDGEIEYLIGSDANFIKFVMQSNIGVLGGVHKNSSIPHAVVWDGRMILDPRSDTIYSIDYFNISVFYLLIPFSRRNCDDAISTQDQKLNSAEIPT